MQMIHNYMSGFLIISYHTLTLNIANLKEYDAADSLVPAGRPLCDSSHSWTAPIFVDPSPVSKVSFNEAKT